MPQYGKNSHQHQAPYKSTKYTINIGGTNGNTTIKTTPAAASIDSIDPLTI